MNAALLANLITRLVDLYVLLIVVWAIFSWFNHSKGVLNDLYKVLDSLVSPYINLFKRFVPALGGIDFTPIIAIILLEVVSRLLVEVLIRGFL